MKKLDENEIQTRIKRGENVLNFGITYLDDATKGIFPADLILLGARSGAGKTQICCEILDANVLAGKRVLYVALEAELHEIEHRLKFKIFMTVMRLQKKFEAIEYDRWILGQYIDQYADQEATAIKIFADKYKTGFVQYKSDKYDIYDLIETVTYAADQVDLIIIDHVHYFDFTEDLNDNKAIKQIAQTARQLALENNKPLIMVAHLRKADRKISDLAPDMDEFHGSSDLAKIATKIITIAPGKDVRNGNYETYIRIPKNRFNGGCSQMVARTYFDPKGDGYEKQYDLGWANQEKFEPFKENAYPRWARKESGGAWTSKDLHNSAPTKSRVDEVWRSPETDEASKKPDYWYNS